MNYHHAILQWRGAGPNLVVIPLPVNETGARPVPKTRTFLRWSAVTPIEPAPQPARLDARRVGFLWNHMFRGEEIFPLLERKLEAEFEEVEFVGFDAFGSRRGGRHRLAAVLLFGHRGE